MPTETAPTMAEALYDAFWSRQPDHKEPPWQAQSVAIQAMWQGIAADAAALSQPAEVEGLAELRQLSEEATPGPWGFPVWDAHEAKVSISLTGFPYDCWKSPGGSVHRERDTANAAFIVACVNHVRAALSQPARPVSGERERIARIIDPIAADHEAAQATRSSSDRNLHHSPSLFGRRAEALAKADAILNPVQDAEPPRRADGRTGGAHPPTGAKEPQETPSAFEGGCGAIDCVNECGGDYTWATCPVAAAKRDMHAIAERHAPALREALAPFSASPSTPADCFECGAALVPVCPACNDLVEVLCEVGGDETRTEWVRKAEVPPPPAGEVGELVKEAGGADEAFRTWAAADPTNYSIRQRAGFFAGYHAALSRSIAMPPSVERGAPDTAKLRSLLAASERAPDYPISPYLEALVAAGPALLNRIDALEARLTSAAGRVREEADRTWQPHTEQHKRLRAIAEGMERP